MAFSEEMIQKVWEKGTSTSDSANWRKDQCGAWISRSAYGKQSDYGWNIDHVTPQSKGGGHELSNLRPLHWENNARKADGNLSCAITSDGNKNVRKS